MWRPGWYQACPACLCHASSHSLHPRPHRPLQIAALLAQATVEVPSPLPAMLGSPPPTSLGLPPLVHTLSGPPSPFPPTSEPTSLFSQPPAPAVPATAAAPLDLLGSAQAAPAADMLSPTADPQAAAPPRAAPTSFAQALAAGRGAKR